MNNGPEDLQSEKDTGLSSRPAEATAAQTAPFAEDPRLEPTPDTTPDPQLEAALRQVLQPELPPAGFADRLMARALADDRRATGPVHAKPEGRLLQWPARRLWISGLVAAALVAGVVEGGTAIRRAREQQRRIVQATQQFETTERVTVHALAQAREQLQRAGVPLSLD